VTSKPDDTEALEKTLDDIQQLETLMRSQLGDIERSQQWSRDLRLFGPARTNVEQLDRSHAAAPPTVQILCRLSHEVSNYDRMEEELRSQRDGDEMHLDEYISALADIADQRWRALGKMITLAIHVDRQGLTQFSSLSKLVNDMAKLQFQWAALGKLTEQPNGTRADKIRQIQKTMAQTKDDQSG